MRLADIAAEIQRRSGKKRQRNEAHSERWRDRETERFVWVEKVERTKAAMVVSLPSSEQVVQAKQAIKFGLKGRKSTNAELDEKVRYWSDVVRCADYLLAG